MGILRRFRCDKRRTCAAGLIVSLTAGHAALAQSPPASPQAAPSDSSIGDEPKSLPQTNVFSSITQSLRMGFDHEVVRGHFDLGTPPNPRRYYCLIDTKTHAREPNGVLGQPVSLPDGTTGLKIDSVSLYACGDAEKQGMLVTSGYLLRSATGTAVAQPAPPLPSQPPPSPSPSPGQVPVQAQVSAPDRAPQTQTPAQIPSPSPIPSPMPAAPVAGSPEASPQKIEVAGVRLGMSLDEARAALKSKRLREYKESTETLSYLDSAKGAVQSVAGGRFVNLIAAWTAPAAGDSFEVDGESYAVMFTPVPGRERVMAIVHSVGYSPANAVHETALENGLVEKYGGYTASSNLPEAPTWRFQAGAKVQAGDPCNRRGLFGGLGGLNGADPVRENLALKTTADELQWQADRCGEAIVTEDHFTVNGGAMRGDRLVTRFTVTAYSPSIAFEGAKSAALLIHAAGGGVNRAAKDRTAPNL